MRVIDENGENLGTLSKSEALKIASERELDLVLISTTPEGSVAKIIDWSKFKYEKSKKAKNKAKNSETKEWWFKPNIAERDIQIKVNNIKEYLVKGGTAKLTVKYVKRTQRQQMKDTLDKILNAVTEFAEIIGDQKFEGNNMAVYIKFKR